MHLTSVPQPSMAQPQGNTIEFSNINRYDIDIQPTGVFLTIHTDTTTHTIKANVKPSVVSQPLAVKTVSTPAPGAAVKKQPEVIALQKTSKTSKPDYHKPHFNPGKNRWSKLTPEQVAEIKGIWPEIFNEYKQVTKASEFLAEIYGCSRANIELIVKGKTWTDVEAKKN